MYFWKNSPPVVLLVGIIGGMLSFLLILPVQAQFGASPACMHSDESGPLRCAAASTVRMHEGPTRARLAHTTIIARIAMGHRRGAPFRKPVQQTASFRGAPVVREPHVAYARPSRRNDPWIARDKALHLSYSFLWTLSSQYVLTHKTALSHNEAIPWALTSGFTIGLTKELYDHRRPAGFFSWRDMTANAVGIGLAAGLIAL